MHIAYESSVERTRLLSAKSSDRIFSFSFASLALKETQKKDSRDFEEIAFAIIGIRETLQ